MVDFDKSDNMIKISEKVDKLLIMRLTVIFRFHFCSPMVRETGV